MTGAALLAAGAGRRMWPYCEVRNKCALPVANVSNIRRLADSLHLLGISKIVVVTGAGEPSIRAAMRGCAAEVAFVAAPPDSGTAGAALVGIEALGEERFLLAYADVCTTPDNLRAVMDAGRRLPAALVDAMPAGEGGLWYSAEVRDGQVDSIVGHDADAATRLCGVFALNRSIVRELQANAGLMTRVPVGGMPPMEPDLAQSLNDWECEIASIEAAEFVVDLDKPWHLLEANARMAGWLLSQLKENRIHPTARIHDGAEIEGFVEMGENSVIGPRAVVRGGLIAGEETRVVNGPILEGAAVIGSRTRISDYCLLGENAVVGSDCIVGHGAEMNGTVMDRAYLYHYCEISGVVGVSADIGAATVCGTLRFDDAPAEHLVFGRRERPAIGANATYFGDYSRTGVNVITMPGVKIGAYSCVGAGIVVYQDVPSRTLRLLKQDTVDRPWGPNRYGW